MKGAGEIPLSLGLGHTGWRRKASEFKIPKTESISLRFPLASRRNENGQVWPPSRTLMGILQSSGNKSYRKEMRDTSARTRKELLICDNAASRDHGEDKKQSRSRSVPTAAPLGSRVQGPSWTLVILLLLGCSPERDLATDQWLSRRHECENFQTRTVTVELSMENSATLKGIENNAKQAREWRGKKINDGQYVPQLENNFK